MRSTSMLRARVPAALALALLLAACQSNASPSDTGSTSPTPTGAAAAPRETTAPPTQQQQQQQQSLSRKAWAEVGNGETLYDAWARALADYVDEEGLVDYAGLADEGRSDLEAFMATIGSTDPSGFGEAEQIAFWINAYNATTVYQVVQRYPIDSVRDVGSLFGLVGGFFKQDYRIAGQERSLDNIEHDIVRPTYNDARIHWTLVCGAFGCPRLLRRPYVGADLDPLLTELSFEFMANPRALQIDEENNTLQVSSYFDWYGGDFEAEAGDIVDYILRYAPEDKASWIRERRESMRVRFMDYDWALNDQPKGPRSRRPVGPAVP